MWDDEDGEIERNVKEFVLHPNWDSLSLYWDSDIALAILDDAVAYNTFIKPICLNSKQILEFYNKTATTTGWGLTKEIDHPSTVNLKVDLQVVNWDTCLAKDPEYNNTFSDLKSHFCAGNQDGRGTCSGEFTNFTINKKF